MLLRDFRDDGGFVAGRSDLIWGDEWRKENVEWSRFGGK